MGIKAEITWKRKDATGLRREVNARRIGSRWVFFHRERRFDNWTELDNPPLEDWLELLDAVERRSARRLVVPDEVDRLRKHIRELFPEAPV